MYKIIPCTLSVSLISKGKRLDTKKEDIERKVITLMSQNLKLSNKKGNKSFLIEIDL